MKNKLLFILSLGISIILFILLLFSIYNVEQPTNFEECVAAGNPIMESYPRQCRDSVSGELFIEEVIGGDTDEHGCLIAAGYSWNETIGLCVRQWELKNISFSPTECIELGGRTQNIVAGDYCHENETNIGMVVGFISPNVCCVSNTYCPEEITGEYCIQVYDPVCGFGDFGYETFSNSCFACLNSSVEYHIPGECP